MVRVLGLFILGCAPQEPDEQDQQYERPQGVEDGQRPEDISVIQVSETEFAISPETMTARPGAIRFVVTNNGEVYHEFEVESSTNEWAIPGGLQPGETKELEVNLEEGTYRVYCPIHEQQGMEAELVVR